MKGLIIIILLIISFFLYKENQKLKNNLIEISKVSQPLEVELNSNVQVLDIEIERPAKNSSVTSPILVKGKASGNWFFEANFPVDIVNWDGLIIGQGYVNALGDWMTEDFVDFEGEVSFSLPEGSFSNKGSLILKKANPSGEAVNDGYLEIPIVLN